MALRPRGQLRVDARHHVDQGMPARDREIAERAEHRQAEVMLQNCFDARGQQAVPDLEHFRQHTLAEAVWFACQGKLLFQSLQAVEQDHRLRPVQKQLRAGVERFLLDRIEFSLMDLRPDAAQFQRRRDALRIVLRGAIAEHGKAQFGIAMLALDRPALLQEIGKRQVGDLPWLMASPSSRRSTR